VMGTNSLRVLIVVDYITIVSVGFHVFICYNMILDYVGGGYASLRAATSD